MYATIIFNKYALGKKKQQRKAVDFISDMVFGENLQMRFTMPEQIKYVAFLNIWMITIPV